MDTFGLIIVYLIALVLIAIVLPVVIIIAIVRAVMRHGQKGTAAGVNTPLRELTPRQVTLGILLTAAGYAGIAAIYVMPTWLFDMDGEASIFAVRLVAGMAALVAGLLILRRRLVSILLMVVGIVSILLATPYIFTNFGSGGTLVVIFIVLASLVGLAVYFSSREQKK